MGPLQHQALVRRTLGLGRLSLQTQVFQRVVEVFVDLLGLLAGLQVGQILADLLDELVQDLNGHLWSRDFKKGNVKSLKLRM